MKIMIGTCLAAAVLAPAAVAEVQPYIGVGATQFSGKNDLQVSAVSGRGGVAFNGFIAVEGELSVGVSSDERDFSIYGSPENGEYNVDYTLGVFAVGRLPVGKVGNVFARVGGGLLQESYEYRDSYYGDRSVEQSYGGVAFGLGAEIFAPNTNVGLRLEYSRFEASVVEGSDGDYYEADGYLDALSASLMFLF